MRYAVVLSDSWSSRQTSMAALDRRAVPAHCVGRCAFGLEVLLDALG